MLATPAPLLPWLVYEQSLTQKLEATAGGAHLEVLDQRWGVPNNWDQTTLKLTNAQVMHREILMTAFDIPCWYARTIIPDTTWDANPDLFDRLKTEPLGHLIFNSTDITRASLKHYQISPSSVEYSWLNDSMHQGTQVLWVRLSEFKVNNRDSFFLIEILLPGLLRYIS